jgi:hypothetical protein
MIVVLIAGANLLDHIEVITQASRVLFGFLII